MFSVLFVLFSFVAFPSVLWYCWLGLLTCKNRLPYNLYCVGGDVKHCTVQSNPWSWSDKYLWLCLFQICPACPSILQHCLWPGPTVVEVNVSCDAVDCLVDMFKTAAWCGCVISCVQWRKLNCFEKTTRHRDNLKSLMINALLYSCPLVAVVLCQLHSVVLSQCSCMAELHWDTPRLW